MLHGRQLPVLAHCDRFVGSEATAEREAYCTSCSKHVHDLSRMTEREVIRFLARHLDEDVCISYRMRPDGALELAPRPSLLAPAALALSLTGCAGHMGSVGASEPGCVDAQGYEVACPPKQTLGVAVIPDSAYALDEDPVLPDDDVEAPAGAEMLADAETPAVPVDVAPSELGPDDAAPTPDDAVAAGGRSYADERALAERMCNPSDRAVRAIYRERSFRRGKYAPLTAADICVHEAVQREAERIERRERRKRERAAKR